MHCASIPTRLWGQGALPCRTKKADLGWDQVDLVPGALLALFVWTCLFAFDRQLAVYPVALVIILLRQFKHRKSGRFRHEFVLRGLVKTVPVVAATLGDGSDGCARGRIARRGACRGN